MNTEGLRVEYGKVEGLFRKSGKPKGYGWISAIGSPFGGSGLLWTRSNHGHPKQIGWTRGQRVDGGGAGRRETFPAAAPRRRGSNPVFQWPFCLRFGPRMITATRVIHLGLLLGSGKAGTACAALVAVLRGGARRREACRPSRGLLCAQKGRGVSVEQGQALARGTRDWAGL